MIYQFLALLFAHWVGDFVFQTHWQASNKSKNWEALTLHVLTYTFVLLWAVVLIFTIQGPLKGIIFVSINAILHFITDAITSRINAYLWEKKDIHNFFVSVGFDQFIHHTTLALTMLWIYG